MACLLFVCMVIGVFAVLPVQASEAKETKSDTDYSALYVQDGLTLFFEAYTGETLDLDAGKWYASNDSTKFIGIAIEIGKSETCDILIVHIVVAPLR